MKSAWGKYLTLESLLAIRIKVYGSKFLKRERGEGIVNENSGHYSEWLVFWGGSVLYVQG